MVDLLYQYYVRHFRIFCVTGLSVVSKIPTEYEIKWTKTLRLMYPVIRFPGLGQFLELKETISEAESDAPVMGCWEML